MSHEKTDYSCNTDNNHNKFKFSLNHHGDATIYMKIYIVGNIQLELN